MSQYFHGPLISNIEVITIYPDVTLPPNPYPQNFNWSELGESAMAARIDKFISFITNSLYIDALSEYNATDKNGVYYHIGRGKLIASYFTNPTPLSAGDLSPSNRIKSSGIEYILRQAIQSSQIPLPNPNRGYFVFMPLALYLDPGDVGTGYGYHDSFTINVQGQKTDVYYAVFDHPVGSTDEEILDKFTVEITHELVEMITDPKIDPTLSPETTGWSEGDNKEIADVCQLLNKISFGFQGYLVTSFWSNQQQGCIDCLISASIKHGHVCKTKDGIEENTTAVFSAKASCVPDYEAKKLQYEWIVLSGGAIPAGPAGQNNQQDFYVTIPASPGNGSIQVTVTVNGQKLSAVTTYTAIPTQDAQGLGKICFLESHFQDIMGRLRRLPPYFLHPAGPDPGPDPVESINKLHQDVEQLSQITRELADLYKEKGQGSLPFK